MIESREEDMEVLERFVAMVDNSLVGKQIRERATVIGRKEERSSVIKTALEKGVDVSFLAQITGIPESEILEVKNQFPSGVLN